MVARDTASQWRTRAEENEASSAVGRARRCSLSNFSVSAVVRFLAQQNMLAPRGRTFVEYEHASHHRYDPAAVPIVLPTHRIPRDRDWRASSRPGCLPA